MSIDSTPSIDADTVTAPLSYTVPPTDGSKPYLFVDEDPVTREKKKNFTIVEQPMAIENIRGKEDTVSLNSAGFQFYKQPAKHKAFTDDKDIEEEYYPESVELLKKLTGASRVVIFDHTIRRRRPGQIDDSPDKRQPVPQVHVDQTTASAIARVHRHLPPADAPALLRRRFQIINLWRPISHPALDYPLTLCDFRSVDMKKDLIPTTLKFKERDGETYRVLHNSNHKWKYVRGMDTDEIVLIKCFDSLQDNGIAILTPHTAFEDPSTPEGTPLRESIELRALVFYD